MSMEAQLSLRRLEVFCLVVEEGGVTRAAERLMVAQPAVSSQLRALEQWLGAKLFVRASTGLVLTEAGQRAYLWAKEMLARSVRVRRDIRELALGVGGSVVIASSMGVGSYLLPPIMTRLRERRTGAEITVHIAQPEQARHQVEIGEADFAVLSWHDHDLPGAMRLEKLRDEPLVLCTSPDGPLQQRTITVAELAEIPLVGVPRQVAYQQAVDAQLRDLGVSNLNFVIRLGHAEPIKQAVIEHGWAALFPQYCVEGELSANRLRRIDIVDATIHEPIALLYRPDNYFSPLQQAALDAIRAAVAPA
ncbi:LysR family transcriptional regulator [Nocardia aurea]|uniref:LysR family transcriptional regulator n=1 Tax=Nocardia aurea TaxID=2144174 RepID=UPI0018E56B97|nr:LysR family transcriptional regulator [Nocardia aurea]